MNLLIFIGLIATSAIAVNSYEFQSPKMSKRWDEAPNVDFSKYRKGDWTYGNGTRSDQFYEGVFRTRIDHFRPQNQERVDFVYNVNANFYRQNGPLYIYLKDYRDYSTRWIETGLMADIARDTGAALLTLDHRYFGRNRPTESTTFDELELLSVEQCLADVAEFVRFVRQYAGNNRFTPVILWGSGFGATLAVWARSRYPHLVDAVWSSSGYHNPALAAYGPYDLFQYTFFLPDDEGMCRTLVEDAYEAIAYLALTHQGTYLTERLNLCNTVETEAHQDVASLYELLIRAVLSYVETYHYNGVRAFCRDIASVYGDPFNSFARWLRYVYGDATCFDHSYSSLIERNRNPSWDENGTREGRRQWYFLQCTQIGSFLLADSYTWLPGNVTFDYHLEKCNELFGEDLEFDNLYDAFYALLNEFDFAVSNVIYTNGYYDPFRYFGRMEDATGAGVVLNMDFASKSADLPSRSLNDPRSIYEVKTDIIEQITRWSNSTAFN